MDDVDPELLEQLEYLSADPVLDGNNVAPNRGDLPEAPAKE